MSVSNPPSSSPCHTGAVTGVVSDRSPRRPLGGSWGLLGALLAGVLAVGAGCVVELPEPGELPTIQTISPINAYVGQEVIFDASPSTDPEGELETFAFDFGDGSPAVRGPAPVAAHTYDRDGRFLTRVTAIDAVGNKFTELREIIISVPGEVPFLICQSDRPYCPPHFACDTATLHCDPDVDGDGVPAGQDDDEPACQDDRECPGELRCGLDGLCR